MTPAELLDVLARELAPVEEAIRIRTGEEGEEVLQSHEDEEIPAGA